MKKRLLPEREFPPYIFIPGKNPHPKKIGGHMEGEADPKAPKVSAQNPGENTELRYALDLLNYGYFWESHVYFEALWNAHGREGEMADFFKALIKLGAAALKLELAQYDRAVEHFLRAQELIRIVSQQVGEKFLGIDLTQLQEEITHQISLQRYQLIILPDWK